MNEAKVKINAEVAGRMITTSKGLQKQVFSQPATLETEQMRIQIDVEVDGPNQGYAVGSVHVWDVVADIVPGRFGPELARRMTLRLVEAKPQLAKAG